MNCVLFAKVDKVSSLRKQNIETILDNMEKNTGKIREFRQSGKVGTMYSLLTSLIELVWNVDACERNCARNCKPSHTVGLFWNPWHDWYCCECVFTSLFS